LIDSLISKHPQIDSSGDGGEDETIAARIKRRGQRAG
jgi:hypothetical protein